MEYATLGRTGLRVSRLGFGGAQVGIADYIEPWDMWGNMTRYTLYGDTWVP